MVPSKNPKMKRGKNATMSPCIRLNTVEAVNIATHALFVVRVIIRWSVPRKNISSTTAGRTAMTKNKTTHSCMVSCFIILKMVVLVILEKARRFSQESILMHNCSLTKQLHCTKGWQTVRQAIARTQPTRETRFMSVRVSNEELHFQEDTMTAGRAKVMTDEMT